MCVGRKERIQRKCLVGVRTFIKNEEEEDMEIVKEIIAHQHLCRKRWIDKKYVP